jgi:predicted negative regulator of RcsB-dependent stress response
MRFSLRDLLWLIVVVAVAVGWWAREQQHQAALDEASQQVQQYKSALDAAGIEIPPPLIKPGSFRPHFRLPQ